MLNVGFIRSSKSESESELIGRIFGGVLLSFFIRDWNEVINQPNSMELSGLKISNSIGSSV